MHLDFIDATTLFIKHTVLARILIGKTVISIGFISVESVLAQYFTALHFIALILPKPYWQKT